MRSTVGGGVNRMVQHRPVEMDARQIPEEY